MENLSSNEKDQHIKVISIISEIKKSTFINASEAAQMELAKLISLLPKLKHTKDETLVALAESATEHLLSEKPNIKFVINIRKCIEKRLNLETSLLRITLNAKSSAARVIFGVGILFYFVIPILFISSMWMKNTTTIVGIDTQTFGLITFFGSLGSIVSILTRLQEFEKMRGEDKVMQIFTGLFRPVIGGAFALFIYVLIKSGIIPLSIQEDKSIYLYAAISFIAGFSERVAHDIVRRTENVISLKNMNHNN